MAETIADYVAKLGLQVDKASEQRFNASLSNLGKTLAWMAAGLTAAATTIQATVVAVSKSFDTLYFAAQRTNSTVAGIKALSYAFSQIGSSGNEAQTALEGLARAMRTNPGISKWLNAQGIATEGRKTEDVLGDAISQFKTKPYFIGYQFAQLIGVSEDTFNKASSQWDEIQKFVKEYQETQRKFGVDPDKAAKSSNELMTAFRSLMVNLDALLTKVTTALQPQLNQMLRDISEWFQQHQEQIVRVLGQILKAVGQMITDFGTLATKLKPVVEQFLKMVEALSGKNGLAFTLELITAGALATFIAKWLGFLNLIKVHPAFIALGLYMAAGEYFFSSVPKDQFHPRSSGGAGNPNNNYPEGTPEGFWSKFGWGGSAWKGGRPRSSGGAGAGTSAPAGLAQVRTKSGRTAWVPEKAARQVQGFLNDLEAAGYPVDDLQGFNDRDVRGHPGVKSAHGAEGAVDINPSPLDPYQTTKPLPSNIDEIARKWGMGWGGNWNSRKDTPHFSVRPSEGGNVLSPEELDRLEQEQKARLKDKQSELFGAPPLGASSTRSASLNNRTSITIYGSSDPAGTGANLSGAQNRVASDLIRNAQSAFV